MDNGYMQRGKRNTREQEIKDDKNYYRKPEFTGGTIGQERHSELLKA